MDNTLKNIVTYICVISILVIVVGICIIATTEKPHETTSILNNIGSAISGFTSSIIGITSIVLVYMAYSQQLTANSYLKDQVDDMRLIERRKYTDTRALILFDLNNIIKPRLGEIIEEIAKVARERNEFGFDGSGFVNIYNHLNTNTFDSLDKKEVFSVFRDRYEDLIFIYSNIDYIKSRTAKFTYEEVLKIASNNTMDSELKRKNIMIADINSLKIMALCTEIERLINDRFRI